jgi:lysophospholipase L1-like esterase
MRYADSVRRRWPIVVAAVIALAVLATVGTILGTRSTPVVPGELAVHRYGFADDGGAPWAPESGQLQISDRAGIHRIVLGLELRTQAAIDQLDGQALEFQLAVHAQLPCQSGWASTARSSSVRGVPANAHPYVAVSAGATCADTLIRIGSAKPGKLHPGYEYEFTADVPAALAKAEVATLTVARRPLGKCDDKPSCVTGTVAQSGPNVELLVGSGWSYDGAGCRRWFASANTSFPCLPDEHARIMTLGDSITSGAVGDHTWRYWAWRKLKPANNPVWVGRTDEAWSGDTAVPHQKWGSRHDAEAGISASAVVGRVPGLVAAENPDILLIDLGTNDPVGGHTAAQTAASLDQIVHAAQATNPNIQIMLAQPPGHHDTPLDVMADLATRIANIAATRTTSNSLVTAVDLRTDWDRGFDTWDGTHPTEAGEYFIAKRFVDRLASADAFGSQYGPLQTPTVPGTPSGVRVAEQGGSILLAWQRVPQASEYRIYLRDATLGADFQLVGAGSRDLTWERGGLVPGHAYEYYVTAFSAGLESHPSPVGKITIV